MKKLLLGLMLATTLSAFAAPFLQDAECTGFDEYGTKMKVNLHVEEDFYCTDDQTKKFKGVIIAESEILGQELFMGEASEVEMNGKSYMTVKQVEIFPEGKATIEVNYDYETGKGEFKLETIPNDGSETESETYELTCSPFEYHMEC